VTGSRIAAVLFDMDGVLTDSEPLHDQAARVVLGEVGVTWAPPGGDPYIGLTTLESFTAICTHLSLPHDPRDLAARYLARVVPALRASVRPLPGVPDVLRALRERGLRLGLASSSCPEVIATTLAALGVSAMFEAVVSGDEVPRGKPAPDVFVEAAKRLGLPPEHCVVIEDSERGIRAARAAGMACVAIPCGATRTHDLSAASFVLDGLPALLNCPLLR
jgi:HAD superfamily hydrolase (TIGR01509 family)